MASLRRGNKVGEGAYGAVYEAQLPGDPRVLVVKRNFSEKTTSSIQNIREADILNSVKGHPHIVEILYYAPTASFETPLSPRSSQDLDDVLTRDDRLHFVFPRGDEDLHTFSNRSGAPAYATLKKYMLHMLLGLERLHQKGIIHFDIKPSNILIFNKLADAAGNLGVAQICDFGLARPFTYQEELGNGFCTSIFRAPELMMWQKTFDYKVDIWAMAASFFQALTHRNYIPVNFEALHPNMCEDDALIAEYIKMVPGGLPLKYQRMIKGNKYRKSPQFEWPEISKCPKTFEDMLGMSEAHKTYFEAQAGSLSELCDLMEHMFEFDPKKRYSATECLNHPFFSKYTDLIQKTRAMFPVVDPLQHRIYSYPCVERDWGSTWLSQLYMAKQSIPWYNDRTIFQAWDLYERYLYAMSTQVVRGGYAVESDLKGLIHSKDEAYLRFLVCLYISIKYFKYRAPSWSDLIKQMKNATNMDVPGNSELIAEVTEFGLISECLSYKIYCPTVYEAADALKKIHTKYDLARLMMLVSRCPNLHGRTVSETYEHYINYLDQQDYDQFHKPIVW